MAAVPAEDDRRGPAPVEHQDRLLPGRGVERSRAPSSSVRDSRPRLPSASSARRSTTVDRRRASRSVAGAGRSGRTSPSSARPRLSTAGVAEPRTSAAPASSARRIAVSRAWSRGVRSLLYAGSCSSSTMTTPTSASGATTASRVPTTMSTSPAPDPPPLVGALAVAEARVDERDPRIEVGPEPIDQRQGERDLGHEHERRPARLQRGARSPRRRSPSCRRPSRRRGGAGADRARAIARDDPLDRRCLRLGQLGRPWPTAARSGRSRGQRPARPFPHPGLGEAAPDERREGRRPVPSGHVRGRRPLRRGAGSPASSSRAATWRGPSGRPAGRSPAASAPRRPPGRRAGAGPSARSAGPAPAPSSVQSRVTRPRDARPRSRRSRPARPSGAARSRAGRAPPPAGRGGRRRRRRGRPSVGRRRRPLGDELQPLEQARRQHRPDHQRRRREVVLGDPARQRERQRRQERPVGPDSIDDRLGRRRRRRLRRAAQHDPECLPPAELDEHGLAILEIRQGVRDGVGEGPRAAGPGRVDRHLDQPLAAAPGRDAR